jgi:hypothetical protein
LYGGSCALPRMQIDVLSFVFICTLCKATQPGAEKLYTYDSHSPWSPSVQMYRETGRWPTSRTPQNPPNSIHQDHPRSLCDSFQHPVFNFSPSTTELICRPFFHVASYPSPLFFQRLQNNCPPVVGH